ncbi:MAG: hypothetical protein ACRC1P_05580 [Cellulosilyticaceae bacterium]
MEINPITERAIIAIYDKQSQKAHTLFLVDELDRAKKALEEMIVQNCVTNIQDIGLYYIGTFNTGTMEISYSEVVQLVDGGHYEN